jgi:ZIP family zinc transporter
LGAPLAYTLALGQVLADSPERFAALADFQDTGIRRPRRLLISASFLLPVLLAAAFGYYVLRGQSEVLQLSARVFTSGLYLLAAVEDMLREAQRGLADSCWSAVARLAGFALFLLVAGAAA